MEISLRRITHEYRKAGLLHLLTGGIEAATIELLSRVPRIYWKAVPKYYEWRSSNDIYDYEYPPHPFKIEYVNPDDIRRVTDRSNKDVNRRLKFGAVRDGSWDQTGKKFTDQEVYKIAKEHFVEGRPWEETTIYPRLVKKAENDEYSTWKYTSREDVLNHLERFDSLYHRIETNGYHQQRDLLEGPKGATGGIFLETLDEVTVDVGRDGELLFADGLHRLVIAKLLELDSIPVVFLVRHPHWMETRDRIASGNDIPDHPDLRDLTRETPKDRWKPNVGD
ncbi:hypothetical protein [Halopiger goleimassiliensis]|uniref:hypothetical protein n=1 Tax=Halopiger goleimassiliensis TaxID=1293048 RepID=UPI0012B50911|nr:hypothetical protein [Halopiger goleimassiliensis]